MVPPIYDGKEQGTAFGRVAIDYITLTTFHEDVFTFLVGRVQCYTEGKQVRLAKRYNGYQAGQIRYGIGDQSGRPHFIIEGFGLGAEWLTKTIKFDWFKHDGSYPDVANSIRVTRLDIQASTPHNGLDFRALKDELDNGEWQKKERRRSTTLIEGQANKIGLGCTLYVGSMKSKTGYMRIYEKPDHQGGEWLRVEQQFKKKAAQCMFDALTPSNASTILGRVFKAFPVEVVSSLLSGILDILDGEANDEPIVTHKETPSDHTRRILWLKNTVLPACYKGLSSYEDALEYERLLLLAVRLFARTRHSMGIVESRHSSHDAWESLEPFFSASSKKEAASNLSALIESELDIPDEEWQQLSYFREFNVPPERMGSLPSKTISMGGGDLPVSLPWWQMG